MRPALAIAAVLLTTGAVGLAQAPARLVERPGGSVARAVEWLDAVLTHVPGEQDAALRRVAGWSSEAVRHLEVEVTAIRRLMRNPNTSGFFLPIDFDRRGGTEIRYSGRDRTELKEAAERAIRNGLDGADLAARGVLLHTDIAVLADGSGRVLRHADGQRVDFDDDAVDHWRATRIFAGMIEKKDARFADLVLWSRASLAWLIAVQQWNAAHVRHAVDRYGDDADVRFLAGALHEMLAGARTQALVQGGGLPVNFEPRVGSRDAELADAGALFTRAIDLNPRHAEARLHYGRVLTLTGRAAAAVSELRRAAGEAQEPEQRYFAHMFLGAALEAVGPTAAAGDAYRAAAALFPQAQAPRLALSHLAYSTGQRGEAAAAIEPLLALPAGDDDRLDPWWAYLESPGRHAQKLLAAAGQRLAAPATP
jgi:hypothetical protein